MPKKALLPFCLLLICQTLPAFWQGPLVLFRRMPDDKSGPSTKVMEETFSRLPALPPPPSKTEAPKAETPAPIADASTPSAPFVAPAPQSLETAADISKLFESQPAPAATTIPAGTVSLPDNLPEAPDFPSK